MAQQVRTWDAQTWLLDPGALFLDFVYTGDFGVGAWREGIIVTRTDLDTWLAEQIAPGLNPVTSHECEQALQLRDALTRAVKFAAEQDQQPSERDIASIVQVASQPDLPPTFPGHEPKDLFDASRALSTIARDAVMQLRDHGDRLRTCRGDGCPIVFLDLSRAGKRAWCTMTRCGNRAKVRAFRTRTAEN